MEIFASGHQGGCDFRLSWTAGGPIALHRPVVGSAEPRTQRTVSAGAAGAGVRPLRRPSARNESCTDPHL